MKYYDCNYKKIRKFAVNILYSQEDIQQRIQELGTQITNDYKNKDLVIIGVLTGSFIFFAVSTVF